MLIRLCAADMSTLLPFGSPKSQSTCETERAGILGLPIPKLPQSSSIDIYLDVCKGAFMTDYNWGRMLYPVKKKRILICRGDVLVVDE